MKCPSCGADIPAGSTRCEYCGSTVAAEYRQSQTSPPASPFDRIKQSPQYAIRTAAERLEKLPTPGVIGVAIPLVFLTIFILASGFMSVMFLGVAGPFAVVPIGFVVIGVLMFIKVLQKTAQFQSSSSVGRPAIIRAKRTEVSGGSDNHSASTSYFITAEFEAGDRQEYAADAALYARVAEGDAGVLYTRSELAQDFDRIAG
jgi:hypothetical protein